MTNPDPPLIDPSADAAERAAPPRPTSAREVVVHALTETAKKFPRLEAQSLAPEQLAGLDPRDARLALAIHRTTLQRWISLEHLLENFLKHPAHTQPPTLRAILLSATAQLLCFDRLPRHAIVNEAVSLTRKLTHKRLAGLANAVLRRLAERIGPVVRHTLWVPSARRLPLDEQTCVELTEDLLPDPEKATLGHLTAATSHPRALVRRWLAEFGPDKTRRLCLHGLKTPPTILCMEPGFTTQDAQNQDLPMRPHRWEGCWLWQGEAQQLTRLLDENPRRRVQDPASTQPIQSTQDLRAKLVIDFCAGRGTKTRQLLALHPQARVVATDPEPTRLADLEHLAEMDPNVQAIEAGRMGPERFGAGADLLVLDVPCSNTAVLARRPEARYRFGDSAQNSVIELQRRIVEDAQRYLKPGGFLLYCTCSLQRAENEEQATWIAQRFPQLRPLSSHLTLPGGQEETYHDGSFSALFENAPA